jgi:hypothetical protein
MAPPIVPKTKINPLTGQLEDDIDSMPSVGAESLNAVDPGGGGGGVQPVSMFPPPPQHEVQVSNAGKVQGAQSKAAEGALEATQANTNASQQVVNDLNVQSAALEQDTAQRVAEERRKGIEAAEKAENERRDRVQKAQDDDDARIEEVRGKKENVGNAEKYYWEKKTGGRVVGAILAAIAGGAQGFLGKPESNPVLDIFRRQKSELEKKLVGEYEASKEAAEAKKAGDQAVIQEIEKRRIFAANQSLAAVQRVEDEGKVALAGLSPAKAKAAGDLLLRTTEEARAEIKLQRKSAYDRMTEVKETNREGYGGSADQRGKAVLQHLDGKTAGQGVNQHQADKLAEQRNAVNQQKVLREKLGGLAEQIGIADRIKNHVQRDQLISDYQATLRDLGSQISIANGQASMTGEERKAFDADYQRGWNQDAKNYKKFLDSQQKAAETGYDQQLKGAALEGTYQPPGSAQDAPAKDTSDDVKTWSDADLRSAYKAAVTAGDKAGVKFGLAEMNRRGIKPSGK